MPVTHSKAVAKLSWIHLAVANIGKHQEVEKLLLQMRNITCDHVEAARPGGLH